MLQIQNNHRSIPPRASCDPVSAEKAIEPDEPQVQDTNKVSFVCVLKKRLENANPDELKTALVSKRNRSSTLHHQTWWPERIETWGLGTPFQNLDFDIPQSFWINLDVCFGSLSCKKTQGWPKTTLPTDIFTLSFKMSTFFMMPQHYDPTTSPLSSFTKQKQHLCVQAFGVMPN